MSYVYFIQSGTRGLVKIGLSRDPRRRLKTMQTTSAELLTLLGMIEGDEATEQLWHRKWHALRVHGEWFRAEETLLRAIWEASEVGYV